MAEGWPKDGIVFAVFMLCRVWGISFLRDGFEVLKRTFVVNESRRLRFRRIIE
jgi:hypothetical protein